MIKPLKIIISTITLITVSVTSVFAESILKCEGGYLTMIDNGKITKGQRDILVYFAYNSEVFAMFFSPQKNDPRDLFVKKGMEGTTYTNGLRTIEATLVAKDALNQWTVDKLLKKVNWSVIGKSGSLLSGKQASTDFNCTQVR